MQNSLNKAQHSPERYYLFLCVITVCAEEDAVLGMAVALTPQVNNPALLTLY